jgi:hypothetical protein
LFTCGAPSDEQFPGQIEYVDGECQVKRGVLVVHGCFVGDVDGHTGLVEEDNLFHVRFDPLR